MIRWKKIDKYEVNEYICMNICRQGDHKCFHKDEDNDLLDLFNPCEVAILPPQSYPKVDVLANNVI